MQGVKDASRLGVAATFVLGGMLAVLIYAFKDGFALLLVNSEASIDGTMLAPAIAAMLIYAALATTFDGLQATASMALRAQGIVWVPSAIHLASFFLLMIPLCYIMAVSVGRGVQGMMEAVTITLLVAGGLQWALLEWKTARREVRHAV